MDKLFSDLKTEKSNVGVANQVTACITLLGVIASSIISGGLLITPHISSKSLLYAALSFMLVVDLLSSMLYTWITAAQFWGKSPLSMRYLQWVLTVPLILVAAIYYIQYLNQASTLKLDPWKTALVVVVGIAMVVFSFIGSMYTGCDRGIWYVLALVALAIDMVMLGFFFVNANSQWFFWIVVVSFVLYGVVHLVPSLYQDFMYNILDAITRVGFTFILAFTIISNPALPLI